MDTKEIPGPPGLPLIGNISDIDAENPIQSLCNLTDIYGPIWRFNLAGAPRIVIASQALMNEISDEERFSKVIAAALKEVRNGVHDGLFTAMGPQEKNWGAYCHCVWRDPRKRLLSLDRHCPQSAHACFGATGYPEHVR